MAGDVPNLVRTVEVDDGTPEDLLVCLTGMRAQHLGPGEEQTWPETGELLATTRAQHHFQQRRVPDDDFRLQQPQTPKRLVRVGVRSDPFETEQPGAMV